MKKIPFSVSEIIRLTIENDLRTKSGLEVEGCLLWASIPCDGGSPIHYLSKDWDTEDAKKMWYNFMKVARRNRDRGGRCAIEWAVNNDYWGWHTV